MKRLLLTTCIAILFVSCMTEKKAVNYLTDHGKLPAICAAAFPSIDSVGDFIFLGGNGPDEIRGTGILNLQFDTTGEKWLFVNGKKYRIAKGADNIDYAPDLLNLETCGDSLLALLRSKQQEAENVSFECGEILRRFGHDVDSLQKIIKNLRSTYKPPKPDTVTGILPHYNLNPPELAACQIALNDQKSRADKATTERDVYKQLFYYALAIVIGLIIIFSLIVFLKFVKK